MEKYDVTVDMESTVRFYKKGTEELHRLDGPAVERVDGGKVWYQNDKCHRLDGPAVERVDGGKVWYQNNKCHRLDGPAVERVDGGKVWYQNNELHRLDGPAIEYANGVNEWFIEGKKYTEAQFNKKIASLNTKEMTIGEIEAKLGHKIKVVK